MTISLIGTNGLLANEVGLFCNKKGIDLISFGRRAPSTHAFQEFNEINLITDKINISKISQSDIVIYAGGAGVQSNVKDSFDSIYKLNTFIPLNISNELNDIGYKGTFVTFGTYFEIGNNSLNVEFSENEITNSALEVPNDYCISKRLLTRYVVSSQNTFKHLHLILPTIYGENEAKHRLIPYTISSIKRKEPMQFTSGKQIRQYLYAGDVPRIILELISLEKEGIYNISGIETYSVRDIVNKIYNFYGLLTNEELFGKAERVDVGMHNLQLDGTVIKSLFPDFRYNTLIEILNIYDKCY